MLERIGYIVIGIGVAFEILGCIGLIRLSDVYDRAVAATKCVTMGTCMMLCGVALFGAASGNWSMLVKAVICALFVLLTSPVAAHAVLRGAYLSGVPMAHTGAEDGFAQRAGELRRQHQANGQPAESAGQEQEASHEEA